MKKTEIKGSFALKNKSHLKIEILNILNLTFLFSP